MVDITIVKGLYTVVFMGLIYIYTYIQPPQPVETAKFHSSLSFAGPRSLAAGLEGGDPGTPTLRHGRRIELNIMSVLYIGNGDHIYSKYIYIISYIYIYYIYIIILYIYIYDYAVKRDWCHYSFVTWCHYTVQKLCKYVLWWLEYSGMVRVITHKCTVWWWWLDC